MFRTYVLSIHIRVQVVPYNQIMYSNLTIAITGDAYFIIFLAIERLNMYHTQQPFLIFV